MANLLGQNIGTNYKGILSLDSTINTPLDATLRAVTDGEGNASGLKLSTTDSSFSGNVGIGTDAPTASLQIQGDGINDIARFFNADPIKTVFISNRGEIGAKSEFSGDGGFVGYNGNFLTQVFALKRNSVAGLAVQSLANIGFSVNGANSVSSYEMELTDTGNLIIGGSSGTARLAVKGSGTTSSTTALLVQNSAGTNLLSVLDNGNVGIGTNTPTASIEATTFKSSSINDNGTVLQFLPSYNMYTLSQFSIGAGDMSARLGVKGYGTTSATTSLLVQNSAGTDLLKVEDGGKVGIGTNAPDTTLTVKGGVAGAVGTRVATFEGSLPEILLKDNSNNTGFAISKYGNIVYFVNTNASGGYSSYSGLTNSNGYWSFGGGFNPSGRVHIKGVGTTSATMALLVQNSAGTDALTIKDDLSATFGGALTSSSNITTTATLQGGNINAVNILYIGNYQSSIKSNGSGIIQLQNTAENDFSRLQFGGTTSSFPSLKRNGTAIDVRLSDDSNYAQFNTGATFIKGIGTDATTTALLVENSAGAQIFKVADSGSVQIGLTSGINWLFNSNVLSSSQYAYIAGNNGVILTNGNFSGGIFGNDNGGKVADSGISTPQVASAVLEVSSTTRGFLPPRMTTTQKNAIATPASGLIVYDTDTNKLTCYNGTTWNDLF